MVWKPWINETSWWNMDSPLYLKLCLQSLTTQLRIWSDDILNHVTIDRKIRYQGSDIFVYTERLWSKANKKVKPNHFPDPFAEKIIDLLLQKEVCGLMEAWNA